MSNIIPACHFDRSKAFYPLIVNYVAALHGFWDLSHRGSILLIQRTAEHFGLSFEEAVTRLRQHGAKISDSFHSWSDQLSALPPLQLQGKMSNSLDIDLHLLGSEFADNASYVAQHWSQAALSLVITAFETSKDRGYVCQTPIWEFLRHCRNAAAHGNSFHFLGQEPTRPAKWRDLDVVRSLEGTVLFAAKQTDNPFLKPADPVLLLWDIEQLIQGENCNRGQ